MGETQSRVPALTALAGLLLFLVAAMLAVLEIAPPLAIATSPAGEFQAFASGEVRLPVAETSRADLLGECYRLSRTLYARAQPTDRRQRLLMSCRNLAREAAATTPTLGLAWTVAAAFSAELNDAAAFNDELHRSWQVAPNEQWLAELRVALVEQYFSLADADLRAAEIADLAILVQSRRGIRSIAQRYVDEPGFRERVTQVVETMSPEDQTRFLREVQATARELIASQASEAA